jgi:hypothetical protein
MKKKWVSILLTAAVILSAIAMPTSAAEISGDVDENAAIDVVADVEENVGDDVGFGAPVDLVPAPSPHVRTYEELVAAFDITPNGGTINVTGNFAFLDGIVIPEGRHITIAGYGSEYTLRRGWYDGVLFTVPESSGLTLKDITIDAFPYNITIDAYPYPLETAKGAIVLNKGKLTLLDGATLKNNKIIADRKLFGLGSGVVNEGTFYMEGGEISNNVVTTRYPDYVSTFGGGVLNYGTFVMNGGSITGNEAGNGGGVYNHNVFTMNGGNITKNQSSVYISPVADRPDVAVITVVVFSEDSGGGVFSDYQFTLNGGVISNNKAGSSGSAVFISADGIINPYYNKSSEQKYTSIEDYIPAHISQKGDYKRSDRFFIFNGGTIENNEYVGISFNGFSDAYNFKAEINGGYILGNPLRYSPRLSSIPLKITGGVFKTDAIGWYDYDPSFQAEKLEISGSPIITGDLDYKKMSIVNPLGDNAYINIYPENFLSASGELVVIASGAGYTIAQSDLKKFAMADARYALTLRNNTIYLSKGNIALYSPKIKFDDLDRTVVEGDFEWIDLVADGGKPIEWSVVKGALPDGVVIGGVDTIYDKASGDVALQGYPTKPGTYTATIKAENALGSDTRTIRWTIVPKSTLHDIILKNNGGGIIFSLEPGLRLAEGETTVLTAKADSGYTFLDWKVTPEDTKYVADGASLKIVMPDHDITVEALFLCQLPIVQITGLNATSVTNSTALLSWNAFDDAVYYDVSIDGAKPTRTKDTSLKLSNLQASTTYSFNVEAVFSGGDTGLRSDDFTFKTSAPLQPPMQNVLAILLNSIIRLIQQLFAGLTGGLKI